MKILILIDGDNIDDSYVPTICKEAGSFMEEGDFYEIHCFGDFVKRKQSWKDACYVYGVQLHYVPGMERQKGKPDPNTSDIALTGFAVKKLYENPEIKTVIIVANDKDYAPLAKIIMEEHNKKAVMFYTQANDTAVSFYDKAVLLKSEDKVAEPPEVEKSDDNEQSFEISDYRVFTTLTNCIEKLFEKNPQKVLLSELGPVLKEHNIRYGKSVGKYLTEMFEKFHILSKCYVLKLGDKKDRIERIAE